MGKFTIDDLKFKGPSYRSQDGQTLQFRSWMGHCMVSIFGPDRNQRALFNKALKDDEVFLVSKYMGDLIKADPGKEVSLVYNSYNFKEKKRQLEFILVLKKDEHKVYHVIIKYQGQIYDFPIKNINAFELGTGAIPDDEKSLITFGHLIHHLKNVLPTQESLSSLPQENSGQRGGYSKGGSGYSGQSDFQSNRRLPSDDDIFSQE